MTAPARRSIVEFSTGSAAVPEAQFELVTLKSGIKSLRQLANREIFHPGIGPMEEASILHVEQQRLAERCAVPGEFVIWDVGLGAAANALCAIRALATCQADVEIHSFDLSTAPLQFARQHAAALGYLLGYTDAIEHLLATGYVEIGRLRWYLHLGDFREQMLRLQVPPPHAVLYDPYSASGNREMWTLEHFSLLRHRLDDKRTCLLTNYTRSTAVRVTWLLAGFYVGIGVSIGDKEETTVAANHLAGLSRPLGVDWLKRIALSHSSSPLRQDPVPQAPMPASDWARLCRHPQFLTAADEP